MQFSEFDLQLSDGLLLGLFTPVCILLAFRMYRSVDDGRKLNRWLLGTRVLSLLLLLGLMMEPILAVNVKDQRKPLVALLVDNSESMSIEKEGNIRQSAVMEVLGSEALNRLESQARITRYRFSDELVEFSKSGEDSLAFDGRATDLAGALDDLREKSAGNGLIAAFLLSDGIHNLGGRPERAAFGLGVPVYAVGIGDPVPPIDLAVTSAVMDPLGYLGRPLSLSVSLRVSGFNGGRELMTVTEEGRQIDSKPIALTEGEQSVEFQIRPNKAGRHVYKISIPSLPNEKTENNNTVIVATEVLNSRMRVLLVSGSPSGDLAYLQRLLATDENLELETLVATRSGQSTYRMRSLLSQPEDRDLVILLDLSQRVLAGEPEQALAGFVKNGGGLLVIGGESVFESRYAASPLAEVLPVKLYRAITTFGAETVTAKPADFRHPVLRLSDDPLADEEAWADLPPLLAFNRFEGLTSGAFALLEHSTAETGNLSIPLVAVKQVGEGKSMAVGVRTFWRFGMMMWGIGKTDLVSQIFWRQAVRWLVTREDINRVRANAEKPIYRSGEPISIHVQVFDELLQPAEGVLVTVTILEGNTVQETVCRDEGGGRYFGQLSGYPQGDYGFLAQARKGDVALGEGRGNFTVGRYSLEHEDVQMNEALLRDIGSRSGGEYVTPEGFDQVLAGLELLPQPVSFQYKNRLWGARWPLFLMVFLLSLEWIVRRRKGMI